jgi:chromosome segregation ATPase
MNRSGRLMIVLLLAAVGLWGCSQAGANQSAAQAEKIKSLEAKCGKLEDDFKSAAAARDQARKRVSALEDEHAQMEERQAELEKEVEAGKLAAKERDELKQQLEARTGERDVLLTRCDRMKKGLQALIGQDDALSAPAAHPATPAGGDSGGEEE